MGYAFQIVGHTDGATSFSMNNSQMSLMSEFMREVGAVSEPGRQRALEDGPLVDPGAPPVAKFQSNSGQLVTSDECRVIAVRLREHGAVVEQVASFFDDAPYGAELQVWLDQWIDFNARASAAGGCRVR